MSERQITIRIPKAKLAKWLNALRNGGYRQTTLGVLHYPPTAGFCCLGVLQHCLSGGKVETYASGNFRGMPSLGWLEAQGIEFLNSEGVVNDVAPYLPTLRQSAARANDSGRRFTTLANAIEACAEGY